MTIHIYMARHASPDWNRKDIRYDIPPGPDLTAQGESEATALGQFLSTRSIQKVYASPLERAHQTAIIAGTVLGVSPTIDHAIAEWTRDETAELVAERIVPFWNRISAESAQQGPVLFVTHGGPLGYLLYHLGMPRNELSRYRERYADQAAPPAGLWSASSETAAGPWHLDLVFMP